MAGVSLLQLLLSVLLVLAVEANLEVEPVNVAGLVGEELQLNCTAHLTDKQTIDWEVTRVADGGSWHGFYLGHAQPGHDTGLITPGFEDDYMAVADSPHDITIKSMRNDLAGQYKCTLKTYGPGGGTINKQLEAMALSDMSCPDSDERQSGETPTFLCTVQVSGAIDPVLTWTMIHQGSELPLQGQLILQTDEELPDPPEPRTLTYAYNFTVGQEHDGRTFRCDLRFDTGTSVNIEAPTYTDSCSTLVQVSYGVTEITFVPNPDDFDEDQMVVNIGDYLNCTGNGNPPPRYFWEKIEGPGDRETFYESSILMTMDMIGENIFRCTATNEINKQEYRKQREITFTAACDYSDSSSPCNSAHCLTKSICSYLLLAIFISFLIHFK